MNQPDYRYQLVNRQINKVRGYELNYYTKENMWGEVLGFFNKLKEAKQFILKHQQESKK